MEVSDTQVELPGFPVELPGTSISKRIPIVEFSEQEFLALTGDITKPVNITILKS